MSKTKALVKTLSSAVELPMEKNDVRRLRRLERAIGDNLAAFHKTGLALVSIREERLYRRDFQTFEDYCQERWNLGRAQAYRLIDASEVTENLAGAGMALPASERQARALAGLDPAQQLAVWSEVMANNGPAGITAAAIKKVVERRFGQVARLTSSVSVEWYTPQEYADAARAVLDGIDLDPASCAVANEVIQATEIFTLADNGLGRPWSGHVYLNPPYGKTEGGVSNQARWSQELISQYKDGLVTEAIVLVNSQTGEAWFEDLWDYPMCFVARRIHFWTEGPDGTRKSQPLRGNVFVYFGMCPTTFFEVFSAFGRCVVPHGDFSIALAPKVVDAEFDAV